MDVHLNQFGQEQAKKAAEWLVDKGIKRIISSPISRAVETAQPLAVLLHQPVIENKLIQEVDYGDWAGTSFDILKKDKQWKKAIHNPETMHFPNGENIAEITDRVKKFISYLENEFAEEDIVACFSHGDIICMLITHLMNWPLSEYRNFSVQPAGISALTYTPQYQHIHFLNMSVSEKFPFPKREIQKKTNI